MSYDVSETILISTGVYLLQSICNIMKVIEIKLIMEKT